MKDVLVLSSANHRDRFLGPFSYMSYAMIEGLESILPDQCPLNDGKLNIFLTDERFANVCVQRWRNRQDLLNGLVASCSIPVICLSIVFG